MQGQVWLFGDNINTDLIQPSASLVLPIADQVQHVFEANRPGWASAIHPGDIIVAGSNFGAGSGRPAPKVLTRLGLGGVIAESINGLFFRNCVNYGLPALQCAGVLNLFAEGDEAAFDITDGAVHNMTRGTGLSGMPWPTELQSILAAGGVIEQLAAEGLLVGDPSEWQS